MSTQEIPSQADFRERAKTNQVPIARLIGFEAKDIADGRATVVLAALNYARVHGRLLASATCTAKTRVRAVCASASARFATSRKREMPDEFTSDIG